MALAEELLRRTLTRYGDDNLHVDEASMLRGQLLLSGGRATDAVPLLEQSLAGFRKHVGEKSPNVVMAQLDLAEAYLATQRDDDSRRALELAVDTIARDHGGDKRLASVLARTRKNVDSIKASLPAKCGT